MALFKPISLHVFVSSVTHRAVLFAAGSAGFFAFVDVSNQTVFGHVVSKIFFKFDAKYVKNSVLSWRRTPQIPPKFSQYCGGLFSWSSRLLPRTFPFRPRQAQRWVWVFSCFGVLFHLSVRTCAVGIPFASSRRNWIAFRPIPDGFLSTSLRVFYCLRIFLITLRHQTQIFTSCASLSVRILSFMRA